jgi:3-dehydroquinate dehydratase II
LHKYNDGEVIKVSADFNNQGQIGVKGKNTPVIAIINGPNMNLLGLREPCFYGSETLKTIESHLKIMATGLGVQLIFFQSNYEGAIVDFVQENLKIIDGVILNPAAYTKTGYAILDSLTSVNIPFVEVHLSNIASRGEWHSDSLFMSKSIGYIVGFGGFVYDLGLLAINNFLNKNEKNSKEEI